MLHGVAQMRGLSLLIVGLVLACLNTAHAFAVVAPRIPAPVALRVAPAVHLSATQPPLVERVAPLVPGLTLAAGLAVISERAAAATALSPLLWATLCGMIVRPSILLAAMLLRRVVNEDAISALNPGVKFAKASLLRLGIVLYGAKLTLQQIVAIGLPGLLADVFTVVSTLFVGIRIGVDVLKLERPIACLLYTSPSPRDMRRSRMPSSA